MADKRKELLQQFSRLKVTRLSSRPVQLIGLAKLLITVVATTMAINSSIAAAYTQEYVAFITPANEGYRYDVLHPETGKPCTPPLMGYRFPKETMDRLLAESRIIFGDDHTKLIELKAYVQDFHDKLSRGHRTRWTLSNGAV